MLDVKTAIKLADPFLSPYTKELIPIYKLICSTCHGDLDHMVDRSLSMREAQGSIP